MNIDVVRAAPEDLLANCQDTLRDGTRFLTMVASDERDRGADRFVVRYIFGKPRHDSLVIVESTISEKSSQYESVAPILPAAAWAEREAFDLFGLRPLGHPDLRPLIHHEGWPDGVYPLRKDYELSQRPPASNQQKWSYPLVEGAGVFEIPVGPIHAGVIEPGHFRFQVMGDSILHLEARLFYTHRGMEKRSEGMNLHKGKFLAERICGVCNVSHTLAYVQAVESITSVPIPERARYLRALFAELERLYNHVGDVGNICAGIGFAYGSNHVARLKEQLMQMHDAVTGHRYLRGTIVLGGVAEDLSDSQLRQIERTLEEIQAAWLEIVDVILSHDMVLNRFTGTGVLNKVIADDFAAVGPGARASGRDVDARRDFPYGAYPKLVFDVPVLPDGDVLARFRLRVLEAAQSFQLIEQIMRSLPGGDIVGPVGDVPKYAYGIGITESPRGENVHFVMTGPDNTIFRYRVRSAAYANWPVVPYCVPGNIVPDFPLINKSFELCYACCDR